jgi:hypothetical protein
MSGLTLTPFDKLMTGFDKFRANGIFITRIAGLPQAVGLNILLIDNLNSKRAVGYAVTKGVINNAPFGKLR